MVQNGKEHAEFDRENNRLSVWIPKMTPGEHFDGLDMLTKLLTHRKELPGRIEELSSTYASGDSAEPAAAESSTEQPRDESGLLQSVLKPKYGFGNGFSDFFEPLQEDLPEIVDILQPDITPAADRRKLREEQEDQKFEIEHYMFGPPFFFFFCAVYVTDV